jgi:hypothetical protein
VELVTKDHKVLRDHKVLKELQDQLDLLELKVLLVVFFIRLVQLPLMLTPAQVKLDLIMVLLGLLVLYT